MEILTSYGTVIANMPEIYLTSEPQIKTKNINVIFILNLKAMNI